MIFKAIKFVVEAHEGQYRKGSELPYVVHLMNVMQILHDNNCSEEVVVAGILHDVLEDTVVTLEELTLKFGWQISSIVEGVSEPEIVGVDRSTSWKERKKHTLTYLSQEATLDQLLVSCADKLDNAKSIKKDFDRMGDALWKRFRAGKKEQSWYYNNLIIIFNKRVKEFGEPLVGMARELSETVNQIFSSNTQNP